MSTRTLAAFLPRVVLAKNSSNRVRSCSTGATARGRSRFPVFATCPAVILAHSQTIADQNEKESPGPTPQAGFPPPGLSCFGPFGAAEKRNTKIRKGGRGFRRRFAQQFQDEWKPRATPTFHHPHCSPVLLLSSGFPPRRFARAVEQLSRRSIEERDFLLPLLNCLASSVLGGADGHRPQMKARCRIGKPA
jgi:hypothetical protein